MLLTTLTETITTHLNSAPEKWMEAPYTTVKTELDPASCLLPTFGIYMVPGYIQYNLEVGSGKSRGRVDSLNETLYVSLVLARVFEQLPIDSTEGVANWSEAKVYLNVRQRIEEFLLNWVSSPLTLSSMESQPLEEADLNFRNFVALSVIGYEQQICATDHNIPPAP